MLQLHQYLLEREFRKNIIHQYFYILSTCQQINDIYINVFFFFIKYIYINVDDYTPEKYYERYKIFSLQTFAINNSICSLTNK
jgi:hypothetical protein